MQRYKKVIGKVRHVWVLVTVSSDVAIVSFVRVKFLTSRDALSELFPKAVPASFLAPNEFDAMAAVVPSCHTDWTCT